MRPHSNRETNSMGSRRSRTMRAVPVVMALALGLAPAAQAGKLVLPPTTKVTLKNGLTVIVMPTRRLPLVDFRAVVRTGSVNDPAGKEGLAQITADLLTQGAAKRSAQEIAEAIEFVGGTLDASASTEQLVVTSEVLKKDFALGLELVRDVLVSPTFAADEFQRKKEESLGQIASAKDDPGSVADRALLPFLLGEGPLGHPPIGWEPSVNGLTREDVVDFHRNAVTPDRTLFAVVGDVDPKATIAAIEKAFAAWKPSGQPFVEAYGDLPRASGGRRVLVVNKPEVTQTQIRLACPAVSRSHPDYYPILVGNTILGAGFTSRLVNAIRVEQGLTYSIGSRFGTMRKAGTFRVTTFTRNETLRKCIDETLKVIGELVAQGPTEEELAKAKRFITGQFPLDLQAPDALARQVLDVEFYGLDANYLETFADRIDAVTMADVKRALTSHFCVEDLRILVVSKPETAKAALAGLGPIEVAEIR